MAANTKTTEPAVEAKVETPAVETKPVETKAPAKTKVPEQLKVRVALAITFSPADFGMTEDVDINQFRWVVREHVAKLIAADERFTKAKAVTKVMPD